MDIVLESEAGGGSVEIGGPKQLDKYIHSVI